MFNSLKTLRKRLNRDSNKSVHPSINIISADIALVMMCGSVSNCRVYAGDRLLLGAPEAGDLIIVRPLTESLKALYPENNFARFFGTHVILDYPHQPTINSKDWELVAGVKGLSRELNDSMVGESWMIKIIGAEGLLSREWMQHVESQKIDSMYLSELGCQLSGIEGICIQAALDEEALQNAATPEHNRIVFSFFRLETGGLYVSDWAAGSRRRMRNKRLQRRTLKRHSNLHPLPDIIGIQMHTEPKFDMWMGESLACK